MTNHVLRDGRTLVLGSKLGEGGEGAVYTLPSYPLFVAKIYKHQLQVRHAEKLEAVCALRTDRLSSVCAWPIEAIYTNGKPCGFVMPLVAKAIEIHELFGSASRKRLFPKADWAFLVHVAKNLAAAVHELHAENIVVGDFNQRNIVVAEDARVRFWDCDSFQVERGGRVFFCTVGVPEFTAPELQSKTSFDGVKRTAQHDRFSLAVMIFYLLFLGRHPFSGDPTDPSVSTFELQDAIAARKFAYSPNSLAFGVQPPKIAPPVKDLGADLIPLFVKAFETGNRPTASEWFAALKLLESKLARCTYNPGHVFPQRLQKCPWCVYETTWSVTTFLPTACPPRFIRAFDYTGLVASLSQCFQDTPVAILPEASSSQGRALPPLVAIPNDLTEQLRVAKQRLAHWLAEIETLTNRMQPDGRIGGIFYQHKTVQGDYIAVKQTSDALNFKLKAARERSELLTTKIELLSYPSTLREIRLASTLALFAGVVAAAAARSVIVGIAATVPVSVFAYLITKTLKSFRLVSLNRALSFTRLDADRCAKEYEKTSKNSLKLESQVRELANTLEALTKADLDRTEKLRLLRQRAESARQVANDEFIAIQASFEKARAQHDESVEARKQEHLRRFTLLRSLENQRGDLLTKLRGVQCPDSLRECRRQFGEATSEYDGVLGNFTRELDTIRRTSRDRQRTEYLEKFSIEKLRPCGLGSSLLINLKSHGIETAADVSNSRVRRVRGFGEKRTEMLVAWRAELESKFAFDPSRQLTQQDHDSARLKYAADFQKAEARLKFAAEQLRTAYDSARRQTASLERELAVITESLSQARADAAQKP